MHKKIQFKTSIIMVTEINLLRKCTYNNNIKVQKLDKQMFLTRCTQDTGVKSSELKSKAFVCHVKGNCLFTSRVQL